MQSSSFAEDTLYRYGKLAVVFLLYFFSTNGHSQVDNAPAAWIGGRVTDASGNPLHARILANQLIILDGLSTSFARCNSETDGNGHYSCERLGAGKYIIEVLISPAKNSHQSGCGEAVENIIPTFMFYPNTTYVDRALVITVHPDEMFYLNFAVPNIATASLSGRFSTPPQNPTLSLQATDGEHLMQTGIEMSYDKQTGKFCAGRVPPGSYRLDASWADGGTTRHSADTDVELDETPISDVAIRTDSSTVLTGEVLGLAPTDRERLIYLQSQDPSEHDVSAPILHNRFNVAIKQGVRYVLTLGKGQGAYISHVRLDGRERDSSSFAISGATSTAALSVETQAPGWTVRGHVDLSDPGMKAIVVLEAEESGELIETTDDNQHGFLFQGLAPGMYRLYAWPKSAEIAYRVPGILSEYRNESVEVEVGAGEMTGDIVIDAAQTQ